MAQEQIMDHLSVDTTALRDTVGDINRIRTEFESAEVNSRRVGAAVGHAGLEERVTNFASNWDHRRAELTDQLATLHGNLVTVAEGFETTDAELADDL